jgi:hypothetical protein
MAPVVTWPGAAGRPLLAHKMPGLGNIPILDIKSDDEEDEEMEKFGSDQEEEEKADGLSFDSSGSGEGFDDDGDDAGDERDQEEMSSHQRDTSEELGLEGGGAGRDQEVVSRLAGSSSGFKRHQVHIMREGEKLATEDDEPDLGVRKHAFGDASRSGLRHYAMKCGTNELEIDVYTSPDFRGCNLARTEEERHFLVGTF